MAIILSLEVFLVHGVFTLNLLHPEVASRNCCVRVNLNLILCTGEISLACGETGIETDLAPEVGGV